MKNHIQKGDVITVPAPAGGTVSGEGVIVGNIFGIAAYAAAVGEPVELATPGVYQLPKATAAVLTVGAGVAWDNTAKNINLPGTGRLHRRQGRDRCDAGEAGGAQRRPLRLQPRGSELGPCRHA